MKFCLSLVAAAAVSLSALSAEAATLRISAASASAGELGYFLVDDAVLASDNTLVASQFIDYSFTSPVTGAVLDPTTVDGDTGITFFAQVGGVWTVTGGGGDSLTDTDTGSRVWIAGDSYLTFDFRLASYRDVTWSTVEIAPIPLPASLGFLGAGLAALGFVSRRRKAA